MKPFCVMAFLSIALTLSGCDRNRNYEEAHLVQSGDRYTVTLSGKRLPTAHDPISMLQGKTYEEHLVLDLPRMNGSIRGDEVPNRPGHYRYVGNIEISGNQMLLNLYYDNTD